MPTEEKRVAMAFEVRRIVTGHDAQGKAVVACDERLAGVGRPGRPELLRCDVWSTDRMPVDNSAESEAAQREGFVQRYNYVGTGQGSVIRVLQIMPGAPKFMHRTETLDYAILLSPAVRSSVSTCATVRSRPASARSPTLVASRSA
jgi:alpha-beta hydrolase superfamily lysophospholipase